MFFGALFCNPLCNIISLTKTRATLPQPLLPLNLLPKLRINSKVYITVVRNETFALMSNSWRYSYVYSYDADMNRIKVNSDIKRGVIVIDLGSDYAGCDFTIYSGRKSTKTEISSGTLDKNGKFTFKASEGKNYTLVVED